MEGWWQRDELNNVFSVPNTEIKGAGVGGIG